MSATEGGRLAQRSDQLHAKVRSHAAEQPAPELRQHVDGRTGQEGGWQPRAVALARRPVAGLGA